MNNQLVEAMKIGEEKARREMEVATHDNPIFKSVPATGVRGDQPAGQQWKDLLKDESLLKTVDRLRAGAYDEFVPDRWQREATDDTYKNLGIPINKQGDEEIEQLTIPGLLDLARQLQIGPRDVEMAMEMWPNLRGIGVNVPSADDTGASDDYYGTPSNNPDMPDGWQLANLLNDLTITGGNKNAAKNLKILKGADRGVPNADRFVEKKGLGAILPNLDQASLTPEALNALRKGTKKGLSSREIRDLIKPFTQKDQFGHPSGKLI